MDIGFHPSVRKDTLEREMMGSLRSNRIDPKLLYVTERQTELWRQVFLKHSPIHGNPEFARIYHDAFARVAEIAEADRIWLVGLGCGTGQKEANLCAQLVARGRDVSFSAIDVSAGLVAESGGKLGRTGAKLAGSLVCDLAEADYLKGWLAHAGVDAPRIYTFFGLVPNLAPSVVTRLFTAILRPGDVLLASAHLAPVSVGVDLPQAMRTVLPQYDNPETLAWLSAAIEEWGLKDRLDEPRMNIGEIEGVPAFIASARWKSNEPLEKGGQHFSPRTNEPLQLFHSLRYTPSLFEDLLRSAGFRVELLAATSCREEAIWMVGSRRCP